MRELINVKWPDRCVMTAKRQLSSIRLPKFLKFPNFSAKHQICSKSNQSEKSSLQCNDLRAGQLLQFFLEESIPFSEKKT